MSNIIHQLIAPLAGTYSIAPQTRELIAPQTRKLIAPQTRSLELSKTDEMRLIDLLKIHGTIFPTLDILTISSRIHEHEGSHGDGYLHSLKITWPIRKPSKQETHLPTPTFFRRIRRAHASVSSLEIILDQPIL